MDSSTPRMEGNQVIPDEAVEAAAKAVDASKAEGCGCCAYPEFTTEDDKLADAMDINVRALLIAREALEAAAPHLMAVAWAEGHEEGFWNGRLSHGDPEALTGVEHAKLTNPYKKHANE